MMFESIETAITAIGALGTASFALVDASKAFGGGISCAGFRHIRSALAPYEPAMDLATGSGAWIRMLRAHWMNGRALADQKAIARAMVRLGLTTDTVTAIATASRVQSEALRTAVSRVQSGEAATAEDLNVLGRVDAALEMVLDAAYERADQEYRNWARALAALIAIGLAEWAAYLLTSAAPAAPATAGAAASAASTAAATAVSAAAATAAEHEPSLYAQAFLVGLLAVPVAPIAKDLTTSLSTAVNALKASRSVKG